MPARTTDSGRKRETKRREKRVRGDDLIDRRNQVLQLRAKGVPPTAIAQQMGLAVRTVYNDLAHSLEVRTKELKDTVEEVRSLEVEKLETMERAAWAVMFRKHYSVSASGNVARHPETKEPLIDDAPTLQAIGTLLRLQERRSKLLGLDAVVKSAVEVTTNDNGLVNAEIARLFSELVASGSRPPDGYPAVQPMAIEGPPRSIAPGGGLEDGVSQGRPG